MASTSYESAGLIPIDSSGSPTAKNFYNSAGIIPNDTAGGGGWAHNYMGVANANISKIDGVAKASISKVNNT